MTESSSVPVKPFAHAAEKLQRRLVVRKGMQLLLKTWPGALALLGVCVILRRSGVLPIGTGSGLLLLFLWVAGCFSWARWRRVPAYAAFSFWDAKTGRSGAFANAWWFETQATSTPGQEMHQKREALRLADALAVLAKDIPFPDVRRLGLLPLAAFGMMFLPMGPGAALPDPDLTRQGQEVAAAEGRKLADRELDAAKMAALNEEEKKEAEKLMQKVQETAKALQAEGSKTAREVLSELERRAREAEQLAAKLGAGDSAWASDQMVAEMRKHADTAELGDAVASKSAENTGTQAQQLADKLKDEKLSNEARDRLAGTLSEIGKKGQPEDKDRTVGQHVLGADVNLSQSLPQEAGGEFQALADKMRTLAAREKAREEMEKLAQQLRQSGSDIAGQGAQGMQELAENQAQQSQSGAGQQGQGQQGQQMMQMQNAPQMQPLQTPGLSMAPPGQQPPPGSGQQGGQMAPVPGTGQPLAMAPPGSQANPGEKGDNKGDKPMLFAPIPGTDPGDQPDGAIMTMMPGSSTGGLQAGNSSAPMDAAPTGKTQAGNKATVNAQRNSEGNSSVRAVEGQVRAESPTRAAPGTTLDAITAEENALDDQALPPARREQVRRYFTELRKRFEKDL